MLQKQLIEDGGSSMTAITLQDDDQVTPCSKVAGKRSADDAIDEKDDAAVGDVSVTKPVKLKAVKIEPSE